MGLAPSPPFLAPPSPSLFSPATQAKRDVVQIIQNGGYGGGGAQNSAFLSVTCDV